MSKITLKNVRLSFPNLFKKGSFNGQENGKFEATFLLPKSDKKTYDQIMKAIEECKTENKLGKVKEDNLFIKDGDEIFEEKEYAGYNGHWAIKAANSSRIPVFDRDKSPIVEEDGKIYAGCYVNAIISPWGQNNSYGKRVNANLYGVQFVKDGEEFGGKSLATADDFDELDDLDSEDEDL